MNDEQLSAIARAAAKGYRPRDMPRDTLAWQFIGAWSPERALAALWIITCARGDPKFPDYCSDSEMAQAIAAWDQLP